MIAQADETVALAQKWLEQIHHLADHAGLAAESALVAQSTVLLGEARSRLESAIEDLESETGGSTVRRV